jgi:hypothetical protein
MQERIERWLCYWVAKPISWAIFGFWLALKYGWFRAAWCVDRLRERWAKRQIESKPVVRTELPIVPPTKRARREVVGKV